VGRCQGAIQWSTLVLWWATAFPNMAAVESDFSMVKWEKNDTRTSLTSLALASIMQVKQFELLKALFKRQNAANDGGNP